MSGTKFGFLRPSAAPAPPEPPAAAEPSRRPRGRPRGGKSGDAAFQALTVYVPKATHRAVKARLATEGGEFSDLVGALLADWLKSGKSKNLK